MVGAAMAAVPVCCKLKNAKYLLRSRRNVAVHCGHSKFFCALSAKKMGASARLVERLKTLKTMNYLA